MNLEIERKFLLKRKPEIKYDDIKYITQCYVWSEEKQDFDRYRKVLLSSSKEETFYHTFKKRLKPGVQEEYEEQIPEEIFLMKFDKCDRWIKKARYLYKKNDLTWEIDYFMDMSLVIAEIELPKENYKLEIPKKIKKEIILEVTEFSQFFNSNLATKIKSK